MKVLRAGAYEAFYDMPLAVDWMLTKRCNYRCSYCFHYGYGNNPPPQLPFSTLGQLKAAVNNIASLNRPWYNITFTGGEPTIHPHMMDLIYLLQDTLKERLNKILIISNCSRNETLYDRIAEIAKKINISMQLSIHTDHVDMEHVLKLIENLSNNVRIFFNLMFNPAKREMVHEIYDTLYEYRKKFPFTMRIATLRISDTIDPRYVQEDFTWQEKSQKQFDKLCDEVKHKVPLPKEKWRKFHMFHDIEHNGAHKIIETTAIDLLNGLSTFFGMYCIGGTSILRIEEDGRCRSMICPLVPNICNIYEEGSLYAVRDKLIRGAQCTLKLCGCLASNYLPKFSSREEAIHFIRIFHDKQSDLFDEYRAKRASRPIINLSPGAFNVT